MGIGHKQDYAGCIIPLGLEMTWNPQEEQDDTTSGHLGLSSCTASVIRLHGDDDFQSIWRTWHL